MNRASCSAVVTTFFALLSVGRCVQAQQSAKTTCVVADGSPDCQSSSKDSNDSTRRPRAYDTSVQMSNSPADDKSAPSLLDTLKFMDSVLEADSAGSLKNSGKCEVSLLRERMEYFTLPASTLTTVPGNYQMGIPDRYEYQWDVYDSATHLRIDFNLKDIDPQSIKVAEVFSMKIIADRPDKTDPHLPPHDRSTVTFHTSNLLKMIHQMDFVNRSALTPPNQDGEEVRFLLEPGTAKRLEKDEIGDLVLFESNDRAGRFAKAFTHAVELCGGRPSLF